MLSTRHAIGHTPAMEKTFDKYPGNLPLPPGPAMEKAEAADILQNDINQSLTAVLLWLQTAMDDKAFASNEHLQMAESNLKSSIKKLVNLQYALLK